MTAALGFLERRRNRRSRSATRGTRHVAQLKYLFEVTGLYPATEGTKTEPVDSNDLAKKLLDSFHFPASLPAEDDEEAELAVPARVGRDSVE